MTTRLADADGWPTAIPPELALVDLVKFCRRGMTTSIVLHPPFEERGPGGLPDQFEWIRCGEPVISTRGRDRGSPATSIGARLGRGATDEEEDSAWAFKLDVVGFMFEFLDGSAVASAYIKADDARSFNVPKPGIDPFAGATTCNGESCNSKPHPVLERYVPRAEDNADLYRRIRGWQVSIRWWHGKDGDK